jgi:hypothetical protein
MAASSRSATIAELRRMFSNLDSTVIESVLAANNGQVDVTIDHLLTMSIDTENENNIQQVKKFGKKKIFSLINYPSGFVGNTNNTTSAITSCS